jgi:hypothetical protein
MPLCLIYLVTAYPEYTVLVTVSKMEPLVSEITRMDRCHGSAAGIVRMTPFRCDPPEVRQVGTPPDNYQ